MVRIETGDRAESFDRQIILNALVGVVFSLGPIAIMVAIARAGRLSEADLITWVFGGYAITGLMTIALSLRYRMPLPIAWTIPGAVLIGPALERFTFAEVIGAYWVTGLVLVILGASGLIRRAMDLIPAPIVFGMVSGVFLHFALDMIGAFDAAFWLVTLMVAAYVATAASPAIARNFPPLLSAIIVGAAAAWGTGTIASDQVIPIALASPDIYWPEFSLPALAELVIPLTVSVVGVQNAQGFAIARQKAIGLPENLLTVITGLGTGALALFGCVPACVVGPSLAIMTSDGPKARWYIGAVFFGAMFVLIGLFAPTAIGLALAFPPALIVTVAGLALFPVLRDSMKTAFAGAFGTGALTAFVVTVSGIEAFGIGAAFWGLLLGFAVSALVDRSDFSARKAS